MSHPSLYSATLNGGLAIAQIGDAIQSATELLSIDQAPTVTLTLLDPERALIDSAIWRQRTTLLLGDHSYTLVQLDKQASRVLRATFEQTEVYKLRQVRSYRKAYRKAITRLAFCESMCRESTVKFHAPEAGPVAPEFQPSKTTPSNGTGGFEAGAKITVKGRPASSAQLASLQAMLQTALGEGAPERALIACVMAATQESNLDKNAGLARAPSGELDRGGHYGLFQQSPRYYPNPLDIAIATREFLARFLPLYRANLSSSLASLIEAVQRSGLDPSSTYGQWEAEATRTVASFNRSGPHRTLLLNDKYEFSRGQPGRPETSWDALGRILSEIGWRRFMVGDTVYAVSDEWLFATPAKAVLAEATGAVEDVTWSLDVGKKIDRATITVTDSWLYSPGVAVTLEGEGPASGKWLVASWERDLLAPTGTLELVKPGQTVPEPVGDQTGAGYKPVKPGGFAGSVAAAASASLPVRERIVAYARWAVAHTSQIAYAQSRPIDGLSEPYRLPYTTDCSGFVTKAYKAAGAPDPNGLAYNGQGYTGSELQHLAHIPRGAAQIGDLVVFGAYPGDHVVVLTEMGDDPLCASHGSDAGPLELRLSDEYAAQVEIHGLSPMTFLAAGVS